jgi:hypothetical protein
MSKQKVYQVLSNSLVALNNCIDSHNKEWEDRWADVINDVMKNAPSGSGIDNGTTLEMEISMNSLTESEKLIFSFGYHFMNEDGYYDGWESYVLTVTPSFTNINLKFKGKNRNDIKDYLHDVYYDWLNEEVEYNP